MTRKQKNLPGEWLVEHEWVGWSGKIRVLLLSIGEEVLGHSKALWLIDFGR